MSGSENTNLALMVFIKVRSDVSHLSGRYGISVVVSSKSEKLPPLEEVLVLVLDPLLTTAAFLLLPESFTSFLRRHDKGD